MATHEDKQMLRDANGDLIPQYWDIQDEEFKPLTGQDGAQDTRLTGSMAEEIMKQERINPYDKGVNFVYLDNQAGSNPAAMKPVDVSPYKEKAIYVENNLDGTLDSFRIYLFKESREQNQSSIARDEYLLTEIEVKELEEGERIYLTSQEYPKLLVPCIGMSVRFYNVDGGVREGDMTVLFYGSKH